MISEPSAGGMLLGRKGLHLPIPTLEDTLSLVVDIGGGTLDVAIVETSVDPQDGFQTIQVRATAGDSHLGGIDYDAIMADLVTFKLGDKLGEGGLAPRVRAQIRDEAERAKCGLGFQDECLVLVRNVPDSTGYSRDHAVTITRKEFEKASAPLDERIRAEVLDASARAEISLKGDTDMILLSGQGARLPQLRILLSRLSDAPILDVHDEDAVVEGLTRQAAVLSGAVSDVLLIDVLHRGIGIKVHRELATDHPDGPGLTRRYLGLFRVDEEGASYSLNSDEAQNDFVLPILNEGWAIPIKGMAALTLPPGGDPVRRLRIVELDQNGSDIPIGVVEIDSADDEVSLMVTVDVDADSHISLHLEDETRDTTRTVLINSRDRSRGELLRDQRLTGSLLESGRS